MNNNNYTIIILHHRSGHPVSFGFNLIFPTCCVCVIRFPNCNATGLWSTCCFSSGYMSSIMSVFSMENSWLIPVVASSGSVGPAIRVDHCPWFTRLLLHTFCTCVDRSRQWLDRVLLLWLHIQIVKKFNIELSQVLRKMGKKRHIYVCINHDEETISKLLEVEL